MAGRDARAEAAWRWVCRIFGAGLLLLLVAQEGFKGPPFLYILFAGLMTLGDVIGEAMRLRRDLDEVRQNRDH